MTEELDGRVTRFAFSFDPRFRAVVLAWGAGPGRAYVDVGEDEVLARFGWLWVRTPRANVASAQITGPHRWFKAIGVRGSAADRGLTFGSDAERMVCLLFHEPVRAQPIDVTGRTGLSVSVADCEGLVALLSG